MAGLLTPQRQTAGNGLLDQAPRRVDDRVAGLLGLDPSIQRGAILPFGRDASGEMVMAWPEMAIDTLKSLMLPGHVMQGGEFTPRDVTEMALDAGMLSTVAPAPAGAKRMFGGISAKNAPLDDLAKAEAMEKAGEAADDIWRATGWGRGADQKWRFEIDDSGAVGRDYQLTPQEAFERAKTDALISGDPAARARTELMKPYATKSTAEMLDEYRRTGGEIVAAAERGDMDQALRLQESRAGLDATFDNMRSNYGPVSSYLKHDELGAAYPDVYAMHTRISPDDLSGGARGQYFRGDPGRSEQVLLKEAPTWSQPRSTTLHELQHAVQQREGFARGGSPTAFVQEAKAKLADLDQQVAWINEQLRLSVGTPDYNRFLDMREDVRKKMRAVEGGSPYGRAMGVMEQANDQYRRLAGEVEARNVQSRMDMDAATRRATPPWSTEDVPRDQQIVRGLLSGDGPQMSANDGSYKGGQRNVSVENQGNGLFRVNVDGNSAGTISVARDGAGDFVSAAALDEPFQGAGIGRDAYDQIEREIGRQLAPSPLGLSPNATRFWKKRLAEMPPEARADVLRRSRDAGRQYGIADRDINLRLYSIAGSDGLDALEAAGKSANGLLNN